MKKRYDIEEGMNKLIMMLFAPIMAISYLVVVLLEKLLNGRRILFLLGILALYLFWHTFYGPGNPCYNNPNSYDCVRQEEESREYNEAYPNDPWDGTQ